MIGAIPKSNARGSEKFKIELQNNGIYEEMIMNNNSDEIEIRYYKKDGLL